MRHRLASGLLAALIALASSAHAASPLRTPQRFDVRAMTLADALDRFSEQSGLQVVYDLSALAGGEVAHVVGSMQVDAALDRLLAHSGLTWRYVDERTVLVQRRDAHASASVADTMDVQRPATADATTLSVIEVVDDPRRILPNEASDAAFGFSKTLLETPRSVSVIIRKRRSISSGCRRSRISSRSFQAFSPRRASAFRALSTSATFRRTPTFAA